MKKDFFTFILIPHSPNKRMVSIKVPGWSIHLILFLVVSSIVLFFSSLVYSSHVTRKLVSYEALKAENQGKNQELRKMSIEAAKLSNTLNDLTLKENQIRRMLGLRTQANKWKLNPKTEKKSGLNVPEKLSTIKQEAKDRQSSLERLMGAVREIKSHIAFTPSIWPIYGNIMSTFGYRAAPWHGFHSGLDIDGEYGERVRAAAGGVVTFTGWRAGYGKTLIINHRYGYETLYGHLSGFAVSPGQAIKKGQRIAYVGMTGAATGTHLHYEVMKNGLKVNPITYLNYSLSNISESN